LQEGFTRQRLEKRPEDFISNFTMGDLLMGRQDAAGAIPYFEAAVRAKPTNPVAQTELGVALFTAGKLAEAEEQFQRALRMEPTYTDARYDLASVQAARQQWGDALAQANQTAEALARYQAAVEAVAPTAEMRTKMALMFAGLGRFPEAQTELEAALKIDANFAPAQRMLADVKRRLEGK
jgi:predicted Zn-dependent protease